jgi:hypothetical protein
LSEATRAGPSVSTELFRRLTGRRRISSISSVQRETAHGSAFMGEVSRHLPAGYGVRLDDGWLWAVGPAGPLAGQPADWLTADVLLGDEALKDAIASLGLIQQEVAEETVEPWPASTGPGYRGFPEPDGEIVGDDLRLWFGPRDQPALRLSPISLSAVLLQD